MPRRVDNSGDLDLSALEIASITRQSGAEWPPPLIEDYLNKGRVIGEVATIDATLGTMAFQNADDVDITGGSISGVTIQVADIAISGDITLLGTEYDFTIQWADPSGDWTLDIPDTGGNDTFVFEDLAQTLTNKTISVDDNTVGGVAASSFVLSDVSGNIDGSAPQKAIPSGVVVGDTDTQTLTNKTIDGDLNTLSDIATTSLKTRTGIDAAVVTGTAGVNGNVGMWNADGDMVDGGQPASRIAGAALTRVDDTNVTVTLGGTPSTSLLDAVSLTMGWTGTLAATRGGTGTGSYAVGDLLYADTTTTLAKLVAGSDGEVLTLAGGVPTWDALPDVGTVDSVVGTANQIDVDATDPANPVVSLSATLVAPGTVTVAQDSLRLLDSDASHSLIINANENLTANHTLDIVTGDADRSLTLAGNATISGTNSGDVTLAGTPDYITISGQVITRGLIDLATDVTGDLPYANLTQAGGASRLLGRGSASGAGDWEDITLGSGLSMSGTVLSASGSVPTTITVANEASDTTCFPAFFTAATGDLGPKTNSGLTFNSSTGELGATLFAIGNNADTTLSRVSAGIAAIEGTNIIKGSTGATDNRLLRADGTGTVTVKNSAITVDDDGDITAFGGQITFPATQNPSANANTLDDYEEGTWTPVLYDSSNNPSEGQAYTTQQGAYRKVGDTVQIFGVLTTSSIGTLTGTQRCRIGGLPFTVNATYFGGVCGVAGGGFAITGGNNVTGVCNTGSTNIFLSKWSAATGTSDLTITEWSADGSLTFFATYIADA